MKMNVGTLGFAMLFAVAEGVNLKEPDDGLMRKKVGSGGDLAATLTNTGSVLSQEMEDNEDNVMQVGVNTEEGKTHVVGLSANVEMSREPKSVEFGGRANAVGGDDDFRLPELVHTLKCNGDWECQECTEKSSCWNGGDTAEELEIDVTGSADFKYLVADVFVDCDSDGGKLELQVKSLSGATVLAFVDGEEKEVVTNAGNKYNLGYLERGWKGTVRVALQVTPGTAASAKIKIQAEGIEDKTRQCMDMKECLKTVGTDLVNRVMSDQAFDLRNDNQAQLTCLQSGSLSEVELSGRRRRRKGDRRRRKGDRRRRKGDVCTEWRDCMTPEHRNLLKNFLMTILGGGSLMEIESSKMNGTQDCFDPMTADPEAMDCDCHEVYALWKPSCSGAESACMTEYICTRTSPCEPWKSANCGSYMIEEPRASTEIKQHDPHPEASLSLDETLTGKRSC